MSRDGGIDWWCAPRFDSPSVFGRLLDHDQGGHFLLRPVGRWRASLTYETGTNILRTEWQAPEGRVVVHDFMPFSVEASGSSRIVRRAQCVKGQARLRIEFAPRPDYARQVPKLAREGEAVVAPVDGGRAWLLGSRGLRVERATAVGELHLARRERCALVAGWATAGEKIPPADAKWVEDVERATASVWREWAGALRYRGRYRSLVERSTLTLKLLSHGHSGAVIAAPTTSLPEDVGGVRNWDYRYAWIRDAAFAVTALHRAGHPSEAFAFMDWVARLARLQERPLRIMYRVDGTSVPAEEPLPHLGGYRASTPVRIGNAAFSQVQLDVYGEAADCLHGCRVLGMPFGPEHAAALRALVEDVRARWRERDSGIWEMRSPLQQFVYSKVMAWVALDRGVKAAEDGVLDAPVEEWRREREAIREAVLESFDDKLGSFPQTFGAKTLDAANLLIPLVGFLPANDWRVIGRLKP